MNIMRGDSYPIFLELTQGGYVLTPEMVADVEVTVGESFIKKYSRGEVLFDNLLQNWYFRPSQEETLALEEGEAYQVIARVKYTNDPADVKGVICGSITAGDTNSEEVI